MTFYERNDLPNLWVTNAVRPWVQYTPTVIGPRGEARLESAAYDEILERLSLPGLFEALGTSATPRPGLMEAADTPPRPGAYGDRSERNIVVEGKSVPVRVDQGGRRVIKK